MPLSPNLRGCLFMVISMASFTINDAVTKFASGEMSFAQIMAVRGVFATGLIGLLAWHQDALRAVTVLRHPAVALRVSGEVFATLCFLTAIQRLELANLSAIMQTLPLTITLAAALFLAEPVGWRRWLAIVTGFIGVMIIVRPGFAGFEAFSLFGLASVFFCTIRDLATKKIPDEIPSLTISFLTAAAVTLVGIILIPLLGGWTPIGVEQTGLLALAAVMVIAGYQFIIMAMRVGDISAVAPFRYTALLWAILLGFLIFGDVPDLAMIVGSTIVVASGVYTFYRERRRAATLPAAEATRAGMAPDGV